jgi:acetyl esterase
LPAVGLPRHSLLTRARRRWWRLSVSLQRRGWNALFGALARMADGALERQARRARIGIVRDVAYGPHPVAHRLDVYRPLQATEPLPVLLYIHGGGFTVCSKETHRGIALAKAAGSRYVVFNINYRLAPRHPFPAAIEDACDAYRWVVAHAREYGGDPRRIVVAGESAGGNLALGVAVAATYRRPEPYARAVYDARVVPCAVMPITPYLQASDPGCRADAGFLARRVAQDIALLYLGEARHDPDQVLMADPIRVLEECGRPRRRFPRVLSGVGTRDLCASDVRRLARACRRLGIPARVRYYEGEVHAFHALRWRLAARRFWLEMFRFMRLVGLPRPLRKAARMASRRVGRAAQRSPIARRLRAAAAVAGA